MNNSHLVKKFLDAAVFGVVGASSRREKFGNKVLRCYLENDLRAIPVHPAEKVIEGIECVASVDQLPKEVKSISIITPPQITEKVVALALENGIENIWMQPGADSEAAVALCREKGIEPIYGGTCLLVELGFSDH